MSPLENLSSIDLVHGTQNLIDGVDFLRATSDVGPICSTESTRAAGFTGVRSKILSLSCNQVALTGGPHPSFVCVTADWTDENGSLSWSFRAHQN